MTEVTLKDIALDTLFDLMIQTFRELLDAGENQEIVKIKKKDLELLQRIIVAKAVALDSTDRLLHSIFSN
ncbi:MAG: hypothetical protein H7X88_07150 [Gloeobacteraceae cyanobacterium ES-bin-316]|nr:hypothetical protein [Ferruginibacter sp.]